MSTNELTEVVDNDKYRQEIYNLKRKLELNETMLREVQETNEMLERALDRRASEKDKIISTIAEKHRTVTKEYENIISNLETKITKQAVEIEQLRQRVNHRSETECATTANQFLNASLETADVPLTEQINELQLLLQEERKRYKHAEDTIEELKNRCDELQLYSKDIKDQLDEKAKALEDICAELSLRRAETETETETATIESDPTRDTCKGNSLFAEVEDRRRNVIDKMNMLHEKYTEIKRVCKSQATELKMLKAERVATLRKWENDADHTSAVNEELIQKYKNRISDLESKLKVEIKKNGNTGKENSVGVESLEYFQTVMHAKNKEMEQLRIKVEDLSTKMLVQEEARINTVKQLQYWRNKASTFEAQLAAIEAESKLDHVYNHDATKSFL